ncbi:DNA mismatch repair protein MutS [Phormidium tenue]|uniref:DNA mismatch repair protein MutS n=1 Tax=Phormidium tenue NIES-30 TaxID=549789 RepID=A0A1U7J8U0_9CYAN|nr:DNA mismatch repair protein MutS [Phormidium tenue]MBD2231088.1 DNA mismatch repair protein MutS [Phormidium tenue FACHB-1052]OKH49884.1 DNA mismatch repair protein MutS [Phormidium tenue NIES-30]
MPGSSPSADSQPPIPERLAKHTVRYADHHSVNWDDLTPMMRHYVEMKEQYPHALVLYRVGDFFETFFQDAIAIARELELVLTSKEAGKAIGRVPLAGIPHHALDRYCMLLVERGYAIAICDQVEDPAVAQGLVKREVTRVITPGTVIEEGMLSASQNNFLASVVVAGHHWGLAHADVSTGEFLTTQGEDLDQLCQELLRLQPAEVLFPVDAPNLGAMLRPGDQSDQLPDCLPRQFCYTLRPQGPYSQSEARQRLLQRFRLRSLEGLGCDHLPLAVRAAGGLLHYVEETQKTVQAPLQPLCTYTLSAYLVIDHQTRRNLEITQTARDGTYNGSLLWALDRTVTAMGGRTLRRWLLQPLLDVKGIQQRQSTIVELLQDGNLRQMLQHKLKQIYDLERLAGRAGSGTANARDLVALADSFLRLPDLAALAEQAQSPYLKALQYVPPELEQLGQTLRSHLVETPPLYLTEGHLIRDGVNAQLDDLRQQAVDDQKWIAELEPAERKRTGISTLKVGFNKAFGYYISISRARADQAPDDYIRKQTLTNEERYITPELKERETRVFNIESEINALEYEIFNQLREKVGEQVELIRKVAAAVAAADVLCGLAEVAIFQGYCCPEMDESRAIAVTEGRHPVVEQLLPAGFFVPNSNYMGTIPSDRDAAHAQDLIILTGPNASGKSCYLRQVGLIQLMAQMGSFVPAKTARLGVCDRIFTRVGAVDDLASGQSTFMVEMNETANILNHATPRSLVLLDEIGRGTATFDGLSIAWAVAEHLAVEIEARTIFATHYHELNELAALIPNVANYQVTVKEMPDQIIFLHQVQPGGADKSYGIEAGRLAGLPTSVIQRARDVMREIERNSTIAVGLRGEVSKLSKPRRRAKDVTGTYDPSEQLDLFGKS